MSSGPPSTAKVTRYTAMYTNQIHKKVKVWSDGYIRHHHYNSKCFLLSSDLNEIAATFYRPAAFHTARISGASGTNGQGMSDDFLLKEGETIEFEESGWLVQVGEVDFESRTNLRELQSTTKSLRQESAQAARDWAATQDSNSTTNAKGKGRASATNSTSATTATSASTPNAYKSTGTCKGFSIPPSKSYYSNENKGKSNPKSNSLITATTPRSLSNSSPKPYSRATPSSHSPTTPLNSNTKFHSSTQGSPAPLRPTPLPLSALQNAYPTLSTPSRATQSPFKPPTLNRLPTVVGGVKKVSLGSSVARGALQKKSLELDWKKFGGAAEG